MKIHKRLVGVIGISLLFFTFLFVFKRKDRRDRIRLYIKEQAKEQMQKQQERKDRHYISLTGFGSHF